MGSLASTAVLGSLGVAALAVFVPVLWQWTQYFSTFVHEAGHALVALLSGQVLHAVEIFANGGGCTTYSAGGGPFGELVNSLVGYVAPPATALGLIAALRHGVPARTVVLVLIFIAVLVLVVSGNAFGVAVMIAILLALAVVLHVAGPLAQATAAITAAWFLLLAGLRNIAVLYRVAGPGTGDDASAAAEVTGIPTVVWVSAFAAFAVYAVYQSGRWLLIDPSGFLP
ncbi:MAG: M50 family metallopeptidase [Kineosporiaceae bacterium]